MRMSALASGALLLAGTAAAAQSADPGSRQTREFLQQAAGSDTFEIMEATTALAQSHDPRVRAFASQMIRDHTQTSQALADAATRSGLKPPAMQVSGDLAPLLADLQSQRGADFDKAYARHQALAHHAALVTEQRYAASGDQAAVRHVAQSAVPVISGHLAMAEQLQAALGGS